MGPSADAPLHDCLEAYKLRALCVCPSFIFQCAIDYTPDGPGRHWEAFWIESGLSKIQSFALPQGDGEGGARSEDGLSPLDRRIMDGEFSDMGSTKARLTQPFRRVLSRDPIGPGAGAADTGMPTQAA